MMHISFDVLHFSCLIWYWEMICLTKYWLRYGTKTLTREWTWLTCWLVITAVWQVGEWGERLRGGRLGPVPGGKPQRGHGEAEQDPGHRGHEAGVHHRDDDHLVALLYILTATWCHGSRVLCASVRHWLAECRGAAPHSLAASLETGPEPGERSSRGAPVRQLTLRRNTREVAWRDISHDMITWPVSDHLSPVRDNY